MVLKRLTDYLDEQRIKYVVIHHSPAYTAREIALSAHIPNKEIAKTVVVKLDEKPVMIVLPASQMIDFALLRQGTGVNTAVLATEREFNILFPGCEIGAMPPFGNLFNMRVFVSETLRDDAEIAFNGGTHRELLKMDYADFERLVKPRVIRFATERKVRADLFEHGIS